MSIAHLYHEIKAALHDAARALSHSPPAAPAYQRVMLLNLGDRIVPLAVA